MHQYCQMLTSGLQRTGPPTTIDTVRPHLTTNYEQLVHARMTESLSLSLSLSLHFNGNFPGEPGLAGVY